MRRVLRWSVVVLVIVLVVAGGVLGATFMGRRELADGRSVGNARLVVDGYATVAIVPTAEREVLLVDAGQNADGGAILGELQRRGLGPDAVAAILITHGHQDHTAALRHFPNARVMAIAAEVPVIEGREGTHGPVTRLMGAGPAGASVARRLADGERFMVGAVRVQAFAMPGHTAGSAAYLVDDVLFVGDSADVSSAGAIQGAPWLFSDSQPQNRASIVRLARHLASSGDPVRAIVPAHSGPVDGLAPLVAFADAQ